MSLTSCLSVTAMRAKEPFRMEEGWHVTRDSRDFRDGEVDFVQERSL